jgi:hypothetical protein
MIEFNLGEDESGVGAGELVYVPHPTGVQDLVTHLLDQRPIGEAAL